MGHYLELNRIMALITGVQLHIAFLKIVCIDIDLPLQLCSMQLLIDLDSPHCSPAPTTAAYSEIACELKKENILLGFPFMTYLVKDRSCR
jgi:hypothetical protein